MEREPNNFKPVGIGMLLGSLYGFICRFIFGMDDADGLATMTFMFGVPTVLGIVPLVFASNEQLKSRSMVVLAPFLTIVFSFVVMAFAQMEGIVCFFIIGVPFFILSWAAAFAYRRYRLNKPDNKDKKILSIALLPFLLAPVEQAIYTPSEVYKVESEVLIDAPPAYIWQNIIRVGEIKEEEYTPGFFNYLGIPRPIEAELDGEGVGGKRTGHFEGGLVFNEVVTEYVPNKKISFAIKVDSSTVRAQVFDQHVLNGNYFNFVDATYELVPVNDKQVKLKLTSGYRLTSKINFYSKIWGNLILEDFQDRLLQVIKKRCDNKQ